MKVAVVGLGTIGGGVVEALSAAGHSLALVDIDPRRQQAMAQFGMQASPTQAADWCDAVVVSVPGPAESCEVALGEGGIVSGLLAGSAYIDCSTSSPSAVSRIAEACSSRGIHFVDAPLSGLPPASTAMVGGAPEALSAAGPILDAFCDHVHVVGRAGAGTVVKLMNQYVAFAGFVVACEAFEVARRRQLDLAAAHFAMADSFGASEALRAFRRHVIGNDHDGTSGTLAIVRKDVGLAREMFQESGFDSTILAHIDELFAEGMRRGWGGRGFAAVDLVVRDVDGSPARLVGEEPSNRFQGGSP